MGKIKVDVTSCRSQVAPLLLGSETRLFDGEHSAPVELENTRVLESPRVAHLRYRLAR
jgi:hypothetical protein